MLVKQVAQYVMITLLKLLISTIWYLLSHMYVCSIINE